MALNKSIAIVAAATATAVFVAVIVSNKQPSKDDGRKERGSKTRAAKPRSFDHEDSKEPEVKIPAHIQREIYKEKRRKLSVKFLAMKTPMYDNIEMYGPDEALLCTVSKKKADWYISKGIAEWMEADSKLRLLFAPKNGEAVSNTSYTVSHKANHCVSCGDDEHYMRHYIVPYCYRARLPEKYKSHMPHDIVLLCPDCQMLSEQVTQRRQKKLEAALRKDPATALAVIPNRELYRVKSAALALLQHGDKIPQARTKQLEATILKHAKKSNLGSASGDNDVAISKDMLQEYSDMETHLPNPLYMPGAVLVAEKLGGNEEDIESFIRDWRRHFLETMNPRFLPNGWGVDHPVHSDDR